MPRPCKCRCVESLPGVIDFKPRGVPMHALQEVYLAFDGFEALRLSDLEGLDQGAAAERMGISRQTFGRILGAARRTVTRAIVEGMALRVEGGNVRLADNTDPVQHQQNTDQGRKSPK
ncbi:DUF134 domain-containing protein [Shumkonia mesophila]|uniref:DUF134 domain-containing protein n=1 Tax=Shumkonia mesophila TaxID=2838854 RepID=UPI002934BD69|nr:DUF134 domain-containing protein [Shumkonia mesophila]